MNIGRNEPCPCGSGKKYKLCCINKSNADFDSIAAATTKSSQSCDNSDSILEELFGRYIFEGYEFSGKGKPIEACELFLKAWEEIRHQIRPEDRSTKRLNDCCPKSFFVSNFLQDLEEELHQAGLEDPTFFENRIDFCQSFCRYFPDENPLTFHNMRRAIADSYVSLGQFDHAREELDRLVSDFPKNPWSYIQYGDMYQFEPAIKDRDKALDFYQRALRYATDHYDIEAIHERIQDLSS